jgi:hypothetical protein
MEYIGAALSMFALGFCFIGFFHGWPKSIEIHHHYHNDKEE